MTDGPQSVLENPVPLARMRGTNAKTNRRFAPTAATFAFSAKIFLLLFLCKSTCAPSDRAAVRLIY